MRCPNFRHSRETGNPAKQIKCTATSRRTVYILASQRNERSIPESRPIRYGVKLLIWFEQHATMEEAIRREKQIKKWNRAWKLELIEETNPDWRDLAEHFAWNRWIDLFVGSPLSRG